MVNSRENVLIAIFADAAVSEDRKPGWNSFYKRSESFKINKRQLSYTSSVMNAYKSSSRVQPKSFQIIVKAARLQYF